MLLERLVEYSERLDLPPSMYKRTAVTWLVDLDSKGNLQGLVPTSGGSGERGKELLTPHIGRTVAIKPKLLADNGEYVLGIAKQDSKPERVELCHQQFVEAVRECANVTGEPSLVAVLSFLEELDRETLDLPDDFDPAQVLTFRVAGTLPVELPKVRRYWARATASAGESPRVMECLVCGDEKPVEGRLPFKVARIPGGQSTKALISANEVAFESYGLEASYTAPICRECGERFSKAVNHMLAEKSSHLTVGPVAYVFGTVENETFQVSQLLSQPDAEDVRELLRSIWRGQAEESNLDPTPFWAAAFSGTGARVVVRDWIDTTIPVAKANLARFFRLQRIVDPSSPETPKAYGIFQLARSTLRTGTKSLEKNLPATTLQALVSMALKGGRLPELILLQVVRRNRAEQGVTRPRAALIKMSLLSQQTEVFEENIMEQLDLTHEDPAYHCGRLLAVLESIQREALGRNLKATITDRFFGAASSAPASVFGHLLRGSRSHLGKLRKERPNVHHAVEQRLSEVLVALGKKFPKTLDLRRQGLFGLGYYHQKAHGRLQARAKKTQQGQQS